VEDAAAIYVRALEVAKELGDLGAQVYVFVCVYTSMRP
jgi:hypothetical protein